MVKIGRTLLRGTVPFGKIPHWRPKLMWANTPKLVKFGNTLVGDSEVWAYTPMGAVKFGQTLLLGTVKFGHTLLWGAVKFGHTLLWGAVKFGHTLLWGAVRFGQTLLWGL